MLFSKVYKAQIVNMTTCPEGQWSHPSIENLSFFTLILFVTRFEAPIALEMGMHYATIAMVTDYD